jgi:hypothetical protein
VYKTKQAVSLISGEQFLELTFLPNEFLREKLQRFSVPRPRGQAAGPSTKLSRSISPMSDSPTVNEETAQATANEIKKLGPYRDWGDTH